MSYIFLLEFTVDDLNIFSEQSNSPETETKPKCGELCVRLQLANLVRCEVCEKDFGSTLDIEARKIGENCLFVYNPVAETAEETLFRISAHIKRPNEAIKLLGFWEEKGREVIEGLARSYDVQNGAMQRIADSRESFQSCESDHSRRCGRPVSDTFKAMYPLKSESKDVVVGYVVVTIRMSCLGPKINQKVLFGGQDWQRPVTCYKMTNEPAMKCLRVEEPDDEQLVAPKVSLVSVAGPVAEPNKEHPNDEYVAELNGNAICIRVEKGANIAVNIDGEKGGGCTKGCWTSLTLPDGVYGLKEEYIHQQLNACKLPVVRGTLKYPAYHWSGGFMVAKKTTPVTIEDFRSKPDPTRTVGLQASPEQPEKQLPGIEICRKGWYDPNEDVFLLKLGKNEGNGGGSPRNQIEIELRTPKGPCREIRPKETRAVQVLEEEFETPLQRPAPPAPSPCADAKVTGKKSKPKPAGKKGKKK